METDQEELVTMIFGDSPPENWRENPEFCLYLSEIGGLSADRVAGETDRVSGDLKTLQQQTQDLAIDNYKTFIQTSNCTSEIYKEFAETENHLTGVLDKLGQFKLDCADFQVASQEISRHRRLTSLTLSKNTTLLEILELPQLMETVVRNQHYEEALQLHNYVTRLSKKQPGVKILTDIQAGVAGSMRLMLQQLISQLRSPLQLPQCLKIISFLRRMDVFQETELRLKFLQAREAWLNSVLAGVPRDDPHSHLTRTMELLRVHMFDIVTQYKSIFSDHTDHLNTDTQFDNRLLFSSWLSRKVEQFVKTVFEDLGSGVTSFESIMGQAMYFGLSFGRVGFDFRPLLAPIFSEAIEKQFLVKLDAEATMKTVSDSLSCLSLSSLPSSPPFLSPSPSPSPPLALLDFPPLAVLTNAVLAALNEIRLVCPVSSVVQVVGAVQSLLSSLTATMLAFHSTVHTGLSPADSEGWTQLCLATTNLLLPYLQSALSLVFPPDTIRSVTGVKTVSATSLQTDLIIQPLLPFLPQPETAMSEPEEVQETPMKERLGEIAAALEPELEEKLDDTLDKVSLDN